MGGLAAERRLPGVGDGHGAAAADPANVVDPPPVVPPRPARGRQFVAGIALGPSGLGALAPDVYRFVLPEAAAPLLSVVAKLGVVLFIHPQSTPELNKRFRGNGWLSNTIGNPLDTTIALSHIIYEGVLDKFPGLKVAAAHGGGYLPSYAPRSDHSCFVSPANCDPNIKLKKKPTEYLNQMYFDSLVFTSEALRHLIAQVGVSQLVLGTDHPIPWAEDAVNHVLNTPGLSDAQKISILQDTAAKLLNIKV